MIEVIFSICHIWPPDVIDDIALKGRAEAVVRDSSERYDLHITMRRTD
jgi:signal transduction histidine kinase